MSAVRIEVWLGDPIICVGRTRDRAIVNALAELDNARAQLVRMRTTGDATPSASQEAADPREWRDQHDQVTATQSSRKADPT